MDYSETNLKYKIMELFPEIVHFGIDVMVIYDREKGRYGIRLTMPNPDSTVFLDQQDADGCMAGKKSELLRESLAKFIARNT